MIEPDLLAAIESKGNKKKRNRRNKRKKIRNNDKSEPTPESVNEEEEEEEDDNTRHVLNDQDTDPRFIAAMFSVSSELELGLTSEIIDVDAGYTIATIPEVKGQIAIELPDPGRYRIEVTPPRPFLQMIIDIEVPA